MFSNCRGTVALAGVLLTAFAGTACAQVQSRGELLYSTHCISCHASQIYWRDKKAANDWASLKFQVRRWQGATGLGWSEDDIDDVTRYLNESIYRYAPSANSVTRDVPPNTCAPVRGAVAQRRGTSDQPRSNVVE